MNLFNLILRAVPRAVAAYILLDALSPIMLVALSADISRVIALLSSVGGLTLLLSSIAAVIAIAACSTTAYAVSLTLLAIGKGMVGYIVSPIPFLGLGLMLAADTVSMGYREGQGRSFELDPGALYKGVALLLVILGLVIGGAVYAGYALAYLVVSLVSIPSTGRGVSIVLAELLSNPFVRLMVFSLAALYLYKLMSIAVDVLVVFLRPSRRLCLSILRDNKDIDVAVEYPMKTMYSMMVSALVVPVVYEFLYRVANLLTSSTLGGVRHLDVALGIVLGLASFTLSYIIVGKFMAGLASLKVGVRHVLLPVLLALMVYLTAVIISVGKGYSLPYALTNPDLAELGNSVYSFYLNFYTGFLYVIELMSRLVGVAP